MCRGGLKDVVEGLKGMERQGKSKKTRLAKEMREEVRLLGHRTLNH